MRGPPVDLAQVLKVRELYASGLSMRAVGRNVGLSRSRVHLIIHNRSYDQRLLDKYPDKADGIVLPNLKSKPVRCPGCGGRVYLPCLLCQVEQNELLRRAGRRAAMEMREERQENYSSLQRLPKRKKRTIPRT